MADKKTEKKKSATGKAEQKAASVEKQNAKNVEAKKLDTTKKIDVKPEKAKKKSDKKGHGAVIWAVIITFLITSLLFAGAFFIFMNLDVISDGGRVRIEHGKIYVDHRHKTCEEDADGIKEEETKTDTDKKETKKDESEDSSSTPEEPVANPNARVTVKGAQLIEIGDFEFYLPRDFEPSRANGNGKYVFSLTDDDGWADVKVYAEKTSAELLSYMQKKDSLLRLTNSAYKVNGTSWTQMESGSSVAYGVRSGEMLYVVILNVKLESDATEDAEQMIPKTIRLKRIYK